MLIERIDEKSQLLLAVTVLMVLVGVWVLPEVTVGHQSAVMVAQVLSVVVIVSTAVVGHDASVGKQSVALVHICTEVVIRREGVALDE